MSAKELAKRLENVASEWPLGCYVWHRACGKRGVLVEYSIDEQGCVMLVVCFGANVSWDKCAPSELSSGKISDGSDGDEWKDGEEGTETR